MEEEADEGTAFMACVFGGSQNKLGVAVLELSTMTLSLAEFNDDTEFTTLQRVKFQTQPTTIVTCASCSTNAAVPFLHPQ